MIRFAPLISPALLAPLLLALSACGPAENDPAPGGVTVGESRALNDAAEMIEQGRLPDAALNDGAPDAAKGVATKDGPTPAPSSAATPAPPQQQSPAHTTGGTAEKASER